MTSSHRAWTGLLVVAFIANALAYVVAVPPFEAPDENSHYEYARLAGKLGRTPTRADRDPSVYDEVATYMLERDLGLRVPLPGGGSGLAFNPEVGRQPLAYYVLPALLGELAPGSLEARVRLMRLASVLLGLCTLAAVTFAARETFPDDDFGRRSLPVLVILLPGFVFISSVLNNDNLANLGSAVAFWGIARAWRRGVDPAALALALGGLTLALMAKRTGLALLPFVPLALLALWLARRPWPLAIRSLAILVPVAGLITAPAWLPSSGRVSAWQASAIEARTVSDEALFGEHALLVAPQPVGLGWVQQEVAEPGATAVTLGFWVRSIDGREGVAQAVLSQSEVLGGVIVPTDGTWRFGRRSVDARPNEPVRLLLLSEPEGPPLLFDGVVLVAGRREGLPVLDDVHGATGEWGEPFANLLVNGSGEDITPRLPEWAAWSLDRLGAAPHTVLLSGDLGRLRVASPAFVRARLAFAREGFIGRFGWMGIRLPTWLYTAFDVIGVSAGVGLVVIVAGALVGRRQDTVRLGQAALWAAAVVGGLAVSLLPFLVGARGEEWPQGRFLYPVLVPAAALLVVGLGRLVPRRHGSLAAAIVFGFMLVANLCAIFLAILPRYSSGSA